MSKRAVILAGGKGTRLRPYTSVLPKPLMPLGEYSILEIIIRQLAHFKFEHITLTVNHQADLIRALIGDGSKWNIKIDYSLEDRPLSTMGPLRLIQDLPENFLVMNGDVLTNLNFEQFFEQHQRQNSIFTISSYQRKQKNEYGVLEVDHLGVLTGFKEKPVTDFLVSMGVYAVNRQILSMIPHGVPYGFDQLMLDLLAKETPARSTSFDGMWLDIGRPDDYEMAIEMFEKNGALFLP